jgi:hypothetical protein
VGVFERLRLVHHVVKSMLLLLLLLFLLQLQLQALVL